MKRFKLIAASLLFAAAPLSADETGKPLWEVGFGVGALSMPDYLGSDQRHEYLLPIPYLVYRGDFLQVDRDKVRGLFYKHDRIEWDVSVNAAVPVKSDDNDARTGMADLDPIFEIGPQLTYTLRDDWMQAVIRLPLRKALAVDFPDVRDVGWTFTPTLALDRDDHPWPGWHASISTGFRFGDSRYHDYYYSVRAADATPARPVYDASGGYGGWQLTGTLTRRFDSFWIGGFLRGYYLGGTSFEDSPLFRTDVSWMAGLGVSWIFMESKQRN